MQFLNAGQWGRVRAGATFFLLIMWWNLSAFSRLQRIQHHIHTHTLSHTHTHTHTHRSDQSKYKIVPSGFSTALSANVQSLLVFPHCCLFKLSPYIHKILTNSYGFSLKSLSICLFRLYVHSSPLIRFCCMAKIKFFFISDEKVQTNLFLRILIHNIVPYFLHLQMWKMRIMANFAPTFFYYRLVSFQSINSNQFT